MSEMFVGQYVTVKAHSSPPGKGLGYPTFDAVLLEHCTNEGWDVVDVLNLDGEELSVYAFSLRENNDGF